MENYLNENFGGVKPKHSSDEALGRWRKVVGVVKNPKRRFRFTANLDKRSEAAAMKRTNQVHVLPCRLSPMFVCSSSFAEFLVPPLLIWPGNNNRSGELEAHMRDEPFALCIWYHTLCSASSSCLPMSPFPPHLCWHK
jgi:hypothetical protein